MLLYGHAAERIRIVHLNLIANFSETSGLQHYNILYKCTRNNFSENATCNIQCTYRRLQQVGVYHAQFGMLFLLSIDPDLNPGTKHDLSS